MSDLKAIVIYIDARYCVYFILNFVERNLRYTRLCLTLIRDIFVNRISDYKIDFV